MFGQRMDRIESELSELRRQVVKNERFALEPPQGLEPYLLEWWNGMIGKAKREVGNDTFIHKLIYTMQNLG